MLQTECSMADALTTTDVFECDSLDEDGNNN